MKRRICPGTPSTNYGKSVCRECGSFTLISKAGNEYCMRRCWIDKEKKSLEDKKQSKIELDEWKEKAESKGFDYKTEGLPF